MRTDPPHFLLDALNDSITSGTFVDTKFYVFSRRQVSGRVGSPRALYCNSRVLDTVPYFSTLFSDGFSEGQTRNVDEAFPSESDPYAEHYDYLSDSDLEDEYSCSEEEDRGEESLEDDRVSQQRLEGTPGSTTSQIVVSGPPSSAEANAAQNNDSPNHDPTRMGKVAVIHDIGAVTFEAMLYFLYTGEIEFAPFSSDPRHELPAQARIGDWSTGKLPSPSAKSVYRLADKYDIPTLKEKAKAHIRANLGHCNIVEEVFSSFSLSFPEILSMQVSQLIHNLKEESKGANESITRKQLRETIAALPQFQLVHAADALDMIWNGVKLPLELPVATPSITFPVTPAILPHWHRIKVALLKSIPTGIFIDVQFYAYNAISKDLPSDPRPLFTSSIVIEELASAITTQAVGADCQAMCLVDGLVDDYESWSGDIPKEYKTVLKYQTEAGTAEGHEIVMLMSGAWRTWTSLVSYAYTNEMSFTSLQTSAYGSDPAPGAEVQCSQSCSPRSMYSLAATLGIKGIMENALKDIQSKLSNTNIAQELFSSFAANHKPILDLEIQFLHERFTEDYPGSLMTHIRRMASGEAPFFPVTLSSVYDMLIEQAFSKGIPSNSGLGGFTGGQGVIIATPAFQASASTSSIVSPLTNVVPLPYLWGVPTPRPATIPSTTTVKWVGLRCARCEHIASVYILYGDLHCPRCDDKGRNGRHQRGRPFMRCTSCNELRVTAGSVCVRSKCSGRFT